LRLVASCQLARLKGKELAAAVSERMYLEYYPEARLQTTKHIVSE
jgi:hypothetical protein